MTYVDCQQIGDNVYVSERLESGKRSIKKYRAPAFFYVEDDTGQYTSMYGEKLKRLDYPNLKQMRQAKMEFERAGVVTYESDVRAEYRVLEREYAGKPVNQLNVAFLDIEVDKDKELGWARPRPNPYAIINAITVHRRWLNESVTIAVCPPTMTIEQAEEALSGLENYFVVEDESELLIATLELLEDADITTGWNSEFFDMPYIVARIRIVLGGEKMEAVADPQCKPSPESVVWLQKLCLFGCNPRMSETDHYGELSITYSFPGKPHLDYKAVYEKFVLEEKFSYKLESILKEEIGMGKVEYEGQLHDLYRNDFRKFCVYNRRDVDGLVELDDKKKFMNLATEMSHMACVQMPQVLGSVAIIEQAVLLELHDRGQIASDKPGGERGAPVAGAFVKESTGGLFDWVCSYDINSLYPSVIRLLNISPETLVGQLDTTRTEAELDRLVADAEADSRTEAWHHFTGVYEFHDISDDGGNPFQKLTAIMEDGSEVTMSGQDWNEFLRDNEICVSANGTLFVTHTQGILPYCMEKWFNERKQFQAKAKEFKKKLSGLDSSSEEHAAAKREAEYWDMIQMARKLFLNSTYGSLLNAGFRFYDPRLGQSVTLSGRVVTKHMARKACELLFGRYDFAEEFIAGDTDSCYITVGSLLKDVQPVGDVVDEVVALADSVGKGVNESFPSKMSEVFFVPEGHGAVIKAGREVVARRGLFKDAKKRYALYVVDKEGFREDSFKIMGMDSQRTDTPKFMQEFLEKLIGMVVKENKGEREVRAEIKRFLEEDFASRQPWENGRPGRVSNLTNLSRLRVMYEEGYDPETGNRVKIDNPRIHFSVIASDNTNRYVKFFNERDMDVIRDGDKIEILSLRKDPVTNPLNFHIVAKSTDVSDPPEWFKKMPFDNAEAEEKIVHKKVENTFGVLGWDLRPAKTMADDVFG